ncbi:MAG TPA: hypothetical protein VGF98_03045 [Candidatus Tumulicola sp.]|jgi:hypothetical protein
MNADFTAAYVTIALIGLLGGYNLYAILLIYLHRKNRGLPILTAREVLLLAAALICATSLVAGCTAFAPTLMARFSLALGAAVLLGAAIRHCWSYRRVFLIRK